MSTYIPSVSVLVPTTHDRGGFNDRIKHIFNSQDYPRKHLMLDYSDGFIGDKLNRMCESTLTDICLRMDSDDLYAYDWISWSVKVLQENDASVVGLSTLFFYNLHSGQAWRYSYGNSKPTWVAGATLCFWRHFWRTNPFPSVKTAEDNQFVWNAAQKGKVVAHDYVDGFMATIHPGNTSPRVLGDLRYSMCHPDVEEDIRSRWSVYL